MSFGVKLAVLAGFVVVPSMTAAEREAAGGARPPTVESNAGPFYVANRAPLVPSAFIKLPIGSITPKGWLRGQLELEANGMTGHLEEISKWCKFENSAWASQNGQGQFGWEE